MENKSKFVFESFQDYVEQVLEKVKTGQLNEADGYVDLTSLANNVVGDLKLRGDSQTAAKDFFAELGKYLGSIADQDLIESAKESVENTMQDVTDLKDSASKGSLLAAKTRFKKSYVDGTYRYSYAGTVLATDFPWIEDLNKEDSGVVNLYELLGLINVYNLSGLNNNLYYQVGKDKYRDAKKSGTDKFAIIEDMDVSNIKVEYVASDAVPGGFPVNEDNKEIVVNCPLYTIGSFDPGKGQPISSEMVEEIIKPAGTSIEVVEKKHASEGVDFFAENEVKISEEGMNALKAMISQYNNITKITVNGAASSKPTSRAGGNEKLAQDRRKAGIDALNLLKKDASQLKNSEILEGTAEVQQGPSSESDPAMQQVSFIISGTAKKSEVVNNEEVKIAKIEKIKGDNIRLFKNLLSIAVKGWGK